MNDELNRTALERAQVYLDAAREDEKVIADWLTRLEPDRGSTGKLDASIWFLLGFSVGARDVLLTPEAYEAGADDGYPEAPPLTLLRGGKEAPPNG
jgi:hypothetical protein